MSDPRFSALSTDPRYRLPSRKQRRTAVDPRFKTLFTDQEFRRKASVDKYGRKIKPETGKKNLEKLYRLDTEEKTKLRKNVEREVVGSSDEAEDQDQDEDDDQDEDEELVQKRDLAREGFSESESEEEESSAGEDSGDEVELAADTAGQEQTEHIPMGEVSRRIACVNLDWDNIRAADIMAVAQSFVPVGGKVVQVTIYPSEFGRERLEREETEGPPREIFASSSRNDGDEEDEEGEDSSDDDEKIKARLLQNQASDGQEFDTRKLRQYQLERLRYYYAIITCDRNSTAKTLYDSMDGREYLSTSNFFDLRFVPDETSFDDDQPHDECDALQQSYKPNDFRTEALTHSKVRLTWDEDDATRKEVQKRAFSRAEMDENDMQAYIGSDNSDADSVTSRKSAAEDRKAKKKEDQKAKMRAALGLSAEPTKSSKRDKDDVVGDMQVTFTSGLAGGKEGQSVFENEPQDEESTRARYVRKERERKQKRKERGKVSRTEYGNAEKQATAKTTTDTGDEEDDPFNDPFFADPVEAAKQEKSAKKAARKAKADARDAADAEAESRRAELELLMADEDEGGVRHFDMRDIEKSQKNAKKKGKKGKKSKEGSEAQEDPFHVDAQDPRFKNLFESHEFAIDPTHARFKGTEAMKGLLENERKKRKRVLEDEGEQVDESKQGRGKNVNVGEEDLKPLAARLKRSR